MFDHVKDHAEAQAIQKNIGFASLIFDTIQSRINFVRPDDVYDVYESEARHVFITSKLKNVVYHGNDIEEDIPDAAPEVLYHTTIECDGTFFSIRKERVLKELVSESVHLGK